jgi:hypothetical protein
MNANLQSRVRKLESRRGAGSRTLLVWTWGKSDAEIEHAIADLHPGPDDIVLPVTWQRSAEASEPAPVSLGDLDIGERDRLREVITGELARRAVAPRVMLPAVNRPTRCCDSGGRQGRTLNRPSDSTPTS